MKLKIPLIIISLIIIVVLIFTFSNFVNESDFIDNGTSNENNNNWINSNLNVTRNKEFTILSSNSNHSLWYMANYTLYGNCIIEWDNHGKTNNFDYCIISDKNKNNDTPLNFYNLNTTDECHVKLIINNTSITPYVNGTMLKPVPLKANPNDGLYFRFQINPNGSDITYSNFKIHNV